MALRLLGGKFRSRQLKTPPGQDTRPTRSLVRESVFNMLQGSFDGTAVLDLFAGSGAMGFEALSRGAAEVVFCELRREAAQVIRTNAEILSVVAFTTVLQTGWDSALSKLTAQNRQFHVIFIDPPYEMDPVRVLSIVSGSGVMSDECILVLEQSAKKVFAVPKTLDLIKERQYGETKIYLLQKGERSESNFSGQL